MVSKIIRYFLSGTLFIVPLVATIYFIFQSFNWLDSLISLPYPGLGLVIILGAITAFGYLTSGLAQKTFLHWFDQLMNRIPLVKIIYSSIKDLIGAFVGEEKKFGQPVLVCINQENNLNRIGFVVQTDLSAVGIPDMVAVYIPQSYAFAGDHFIVHRKNITPLEIPTPVAMKFIVSGGITNLKA